MVRQGASLETARRILRHRSVETTSIYAKVDLPLLRMVLRPWPEGDIQPC
jgi:site-specific recombinase XerD